MKVNKLIGIVGGVGPHAGIDLFRKIIDQTIAKTDQEHLPVALLSFPGEVEDRTSFILGHTSNNPAFEIAKIIKKLEELGANIVAIACNAAHSPQIYNVIVEEMRKIKCRVKLIHLINEVAEFIMVNYSHIKKVGVLCTNGTYKSKIYPDIFRQKGIDVILPDEKLQKMVHNSICDPAYGIKAQSEPVTDMAKRELKEAINYLHKKGAEAIILGCTEIPLAIKEKKKGKTFIIDPSMILARALIKDVDINKLKPYLPYSIDCKIH